ncbi:hypothetical protein Ocin01_07118, partial [Orchesella cincta]
YKYFGKLDESSSLIGVASDKKHYISSHPLNINHGFQTFLLVVLLSLAFAAVPRMPLPISSSSLSTSTDPVDSDNNSNNTEDLDEAET